MIPILYDKYETDFLSNGLGQLGDCLSCTVTEEINGIYEVEFTYPITGAYYEQLINFGGVVACTHDHNGDVQFFDIYKYTAPIDGIVTFYGSHVSYRLSNYFLTGHEGLPLPSSPAEVFASWESMIARYGREVPPWHFTFVDHTGIAPSPTSRYVGIHGAYSVRASMLSTEWQTGKEEPYEYVPQPIFVYGSFVQVWGGEFQFDNFTVNYYTKRGQDRGVQIRYGKNMVGVERSRDTGSIISAIIAEYTREGTMYATWVYSPKMASDISPWQSYGEQMYSGTDMLFLRPAIVNYAAIDFTSEITEPNEANARQAALDYMSKNSTWRADDNITVEFLDLYGTPEYENIQGLTDCRLGDFVSILYPQLGIVSNGVEIMSLTYDVLAERVTQMQLNTIRTTLAQVIIDSIGGE